ncbi:MAG: coat protein [Sanya nodavirus 1]|nr:MAG: coat protein [Sanya nodavirus 1]
MNNQRNSTVSNARRRRVRQVKRPAPTSQVVEEIIVDTIAPAQPGRNRRRRRQRNRRQRLSANGGGAPTAAPVAFQSVYRNNQLPAKVVISGTDWIESDAVSSGTADGAVLVDLEIQPLNLTDTHLSQVARGFERYRFTKLEAIITSRAPTTVGGGYLAGFTPDVYQGVFSVGATNKKYVRSLFGSVSAPWWQTTRVQCDVRNSELFYYTNRNAAESYKTTQSKLMLVVDGPPVNIAGNITVSVQLQWTVELSQPAVNSSRSEAVVDLPVGEVFTQFSTYKGTVLCSSGQLLNWYTHAEYDNVYAIDPPIPAGEVAVEQVGAIYSHTNEKEKIAYLHKTVADAYVASAAGANEGGVRLRSGAALRTAVRLFQQPARETIKKQLRALELQHHDSEISLSDLVLEQGN